MKKWDGFDTAIIGITQLWQEGERVNALVYRGEKMLKVLEDRDGMTHSDAQDYIDFNVEGAYIGKDTPVIVWGLPDHWEEEDL